DPVFDAARLENLNDQPVAAVIVGDAAERSGCWRATWRRLRPYRSRGNVVRIKSVRVRKLPEVWRVRRVGLFYQENGIAFGTVNRRKGADRRLISAALSKKIAPSVRSSGSVR